ncbi:bifunctional phosphopantothenoylcysteine decarboxylase/phosphopantothenate--cysteine ligase CoaBC [Chloroflexota bacterium]
MSVLTDKTIILGVTGGVAAYKAIDVASKLRQEGTTVEVVMTSAALEFVKPLSFRSVTGRPVVTDMFDMASEFNIEHIALAQAADVVLIAPATANTIAKLASGIADNILCTTILATKAPVVIAPAMNTGMWENPATQDNLAKLEHRGFNIVGPGYGWLAEGRTGMGRMSDPVELIGTVKQVLGRHGDLHSRHVVITSGGTQEPIDPVRHIGNRSSGKMGYALAEAARDRGASVTLITGPVTLADPIGTKVVHVQTAEEMYHAVEDAIVDTDALIMGAAVADYRPREVATDKIKKDLDQLVIPMVRTRDILGEVKGKFIKIGFAAESSNLLDNAGKKLKRKGLDLIIANDISHADSGFGADMNRVIILEPGGKTQDLPLLPKKEVADRVLDRLIKLLANKGNRA